MKQLIQNLKTGQTSLEEVPVPALRFNTILIQATHSLISLGTEKMLVDFGKASYLSKARQQPEKVKQVLDKIKTEGILPTLEAVFNKLDQPIPLGYCHVGNVLEIGDGVSEFAVGDRVVSNGNHAEFVCIPKNLVCKIPDNVSDEEATFTVIGSIGLQGIRLLNPSFGETIVVIGLGLIGLITAELLVSNGCRVIGFDFDDNKIKIAREKGILAYNPKEGLDVVKTVENLTEAIGADGVIITASNKNNEIIEQAAKMSRKRGRIILVGVTGLNINRSDFYEKELSFQVSCSYGPGRYDDNYEQKGQDYPLPFVRWTEKRNFESILFAIASQKLDVKPLITEVVSFEDFDMIYGNMGKGAIASILKYDTNLKIERTIQVNKTIANQKGRIGIIGAGNFAKMTVLPILKKLNAEIEIIASANGLNATSMAKKYGISSATSDNRAIFENPSVSTVIITTRHNQHASMAVEALQKGKHVFIEKPLALNAIELGEIIEVYNNSKASLTVGFNRRFSPHAQKIKSLVNGSQINVIATMNAGFIPKESWVNDLKIGGGRIIGEACHFIDLITFFTGSKVASVCMNAMGINPLESTDNASILLKYVNGSTGVINYFSNGSKSYSKERVEVYSQERTLIIDNFRSLEAFGCKSFSGLKTKLDKGHQEQFNQLLKLSKGEIESMIPFDEIVNTTKSSFAAIDSLKTKSWVNVD